MNYSLVSKTAASLSLIGLLAACGGGGGNATSSLPSELPATLTGVAASGAPIAGSTVTLTCSQGTTMTTTTDANGAYSFSLATSTCTAPYLITVTGTVGDAQVTLVSVQATTPAAGGSATVNVTPLTHAIAAALSSTGDPIDLANNFGTEKANITGIAVTAAKGTLVTALAGTITQAGGDPKTFDPINTAFSANRTGLDQMLDNLQVQVTTAGVSIASAGAVAVVDDMGNNPTGAPADFSAGTVNIRKTDTPATVTSLAAATTSLPDNGIGDSIRDALNACFAQPKATRGSLATTLSSACQAVPIDSKYLHDGKTGSQEFDPYFTSSTYDNAKFMAPAVIRFFSNSATDTRALVKFALTRADGVVESFTTVGEKSTATGGVKKLRGNQRLFKVFVNGFVNKRVEIANKNSTNPKSTFYSTGINFFLGMVEGGAGGTSGASTTGRKVGYVNVTGPGLPAAGLFLRPTLAGCDSYYAIATSATATPPRCTSLYRMSSRAASATDTDNFSSLYGNATRADFPAAPVSDANLLAIKPLSAYTFKLFNTSGVLIATYIERLRSRPLTMGTVANLDGEIDKVRWNTLSADTITALDTSQGKAFVGGNPSSFAVKWTNQPNTAPTYSVQVQSQQATSPTATSLFQDQIFVPFSASSGALTNGTQGWPNMNSTSTTGFNLVQLISRNQFDTQLFADWIY
jgi:hypothetical protein